MDRTLASLGLMFCVALCACDQPMPSDSSDSSESSDPRSKLPGHHHGHHRYPGAHWQHGAPHHHGLSASGLATMAAAAEALDSTCLMVIHDGVVVGDWYAPGYGPDTLHDNLFSITKSLTSTLFGIARDRGALGLADPASDTLDAWIGTASQAVKLRDLLSNDSGRFWSFASDYGNLMVSADQTSYGLGLDQAAPPGVIWEYNNSAVQTLERVLEVATGEDVEAFAQANLFAPIGMTATLARDPADNPLVYQGLSTSCADIARFGYLMLREGKWKDQQIVAKAWVKKATKPSTDLNAGYGYLWWLNRQGQVVEPSFPNRTEYEGKLIPASPDSTFFAVGAFGQFVAIDPEGEYVVVRLQEITDLQQALATDPDPVGLAKVRELMTAFEAAKI